MDKQIREFFARKELAEIALLTHGESQPGAGWYYPVRSTKHLAAAELQREWD